MARRLLLATGGLLMVGLLVRRSMRLRDETMMKLVPSRDPWTPITETRPER
jgi:hypothetical protein